MPRPQTIQIFLPADDLRGMRVAEITTRIVRVIEVPRSQLADFLKLPEAPQVPLAHETLCAQVVQLPPEERMQVVERILNSLDEPDVSLDALWAKEVDDRLTAYRRGEVRAFTLSEVIARCH